MRNLEEVARAALRRLGVETYRRRDTPAHIGLWYEGRKIASMGVRVSRWVTAFGFALNVEGDLTPSELIRPCGIEDARLVSLESVLSSAPQRDAVIDAVREAFIAVFHRKARPLSETVRKRLFMGDTCGQPSPRQDGTHDR
jgi:lipoate-protein ligase B